jgi:hypothetical protein
MNLDVLFYSVPGMVVVRNFLLLEFTSEVTNICLLSKRDSGLGGCGLGK